MQAAGPHASLVKVTDSVSNNDTNVDGKYRTLSELKGHEVNMICKENCLFSQRALVRGNPARVDFAPENSLGKMLASLSGYCFFVKQDSGSLLSKILALMN